MPEVAEEVNQEKPKAKEQRVLVPERFSEVEFKEHRWIVDAEAGTTLEQVCESSYWAHVAKDMEPFDEIKVRSEDGAWVAYLLVKYAERNYAIVVVDRVLKLEGDFTPAKSVKHKIEWKGPHHRFVVIRLSDSKMLQTGFKSRYDAETWMLQHEKAA